MNKNFVVTPGFQRQSSVEHRVFAEKSSVLSSVFFKSPQWRLELAKFCYFFFCWNEMLQPVVFPVLNGVANFIYKGKCSRSIPYKNQLNNNILCSFSGSGASSVPIPGSNFQNAYRPSFIFVLCLSSLFSYTSTLVLHLLSPISRPWTLASLSACLLTCPSSLTFRTWSGIFCLFSSPVLGFLCQYCYPYL